MYLHCWLRALSDFCQAENLLGEAKDTLIQITNKTSQAICSFQKGLVALKVRLMIISHNFFLVTCNANFVEKDTGIPVEFATYASCCVTCTAVYNYFANWACCIALRCPI